MSQVKEVRKVDISKDERAIRHNRISKKTGLIIALVCTIILIAGIIGMSFAAYGIAAKVWNEKVGDEAGVPFNELFTIFKGVTKADEEVIVTNKYTEDDLDGFYDNLKNKLYLADDYEIDITKLLSAFLSNSEEKDDTQQSQEQVTLSLEGTDGYDLVYVYTYPDGRQLKSEVALTDEQLADGEGDATLPDDQPVEEEQTPAQQGTGNEALDNLLKELQFDFSSLENYNGEKNILEISDKQLAAVVDAVYGSLSEIVPQIGDIEEKIGNKLDAVMEVKQIIISGDVINPDTVKLKITLSLKARELVSKIIDDKGLPSFIKKLVPENLYATAIVYPNDSSKAVQASVNQMSEFNTDKVVSIVDVILKKLGNDLNIHDLLVSVNTKIVDFLEGLQAKLPVNFVTTGSVDTYPIETLMKTLNVEVSEQAFLYMMRDIKLPTEQSLGYDVYTDERKARETNEFVDDLTAKYCIDNTDGIISSTNTISDVINLASSDSFLQTVKIQNIEYYSAYVANIYRARTSYVALANMLTAYVREQNMLGDLDAEIITMSYEQLKSVLSVDFKVNVSAMLGFDDGSTMSNLIKQLVPAEIFVRANICLDESLGIATNMEVNLVGTEKSQEHLATLTALASAFGMNMDNLNYDKICEQIDSGIRQGLQKIKDATGCDVIFETGEAYMPNLFEIVSADEKVNGNISEDEHVITDAEVWEVMKGLYDYEYVDDGSFVPSDDISHFIDELYYKYFISDSFKEELIASQENNTFLDTLKKGVGQDFSSSKVRLEDKTVEGVDGTLQTIDGIMSANNITPDYDEAEITARFKPVFLIEEVAYLINTQDELLQSLSFLKDLNVIYAYNNSDEMSLIVEGKGNLSDPDMNALLPEKINVNLILNLGQINADGTRDDLLVNRLGVNDINDFDVVSSASMTRLDLLFLFISRISRDSESGEPQEEMTAESVSADIEKGLNEDVYEDDGVTVKTVCLKNQLHNDVYTVTFLESGGFRVNETIYEIVINELYKPQEGEPDPDPSEIPRENDFRNAICKINNMPDTTTYTASTRQDYIIDLLNGNKAADANNAIDEINGKYFLVDSAKLSYEFTGNVLDSISAKAKNYATAIDGRAMAESTLTIDQSRPVIDGTEMLVMLESSIKITAKGYENATMKGLYVTRNSNALTGEKGELILVFDSPVDKTIADLKYQDLLPERLALLVVVDMNKLAISDALCTNVYVNDLTQNEMNAINSLLIKITEDKNSAGGDSMDLAALNGECSASVKSTMQDLNDNMSLTLTAGVTSQTDGVKSSTAGSFKLESAYEIAAENLSDEQTEVTTEELRDLLKALFAEFTAQGYTGGATSLTDTSDESQKNSYNVLIQPSLATMQATVEGKIGEGNLMSKIDMVKLGADFGVDNTEQTAFVSTSDNDSTGVFASLRTDFALDGSKEYFLITFMIETSSIIGNTSPDAGKVTLLPDAVYATFCVDISSSTTDMHVVYNTMNQSQTALLEKIIAKNQGDAPDSCISQEKLDKMKNDLMDTVLLTYIYSGYGTMELTLREVLLYGGVVIMPNDHTNSAVDGIGMLTFDITKTMLSI